MGDSGENLKKKNQCSHSAPVTNLTETFITRDPSLSSGVSSESAELWDEKIWGGKKCKRITPKECSVSVFLKP